MSSLMKDNLKLAGAVLSIPVSTVAVALCGPLVLSSDVSIWCESYELVCALAFWFVLTAIVVLFASRIYNFRIVGTCALGLGASAVICLLGWSPSPGWLGALSAIPALVGIGTLIVGAVSPLLTLALTLGMLEERSTPQSDIETSAVRDYDLTCEDAP